MTGRAWESSEVLVTGGHGFLGSHLCDALRSLHVKKLVAPTRSECDLRDPDAVRKVLKGKAFDVVFHLAASVGGIGANRKHPADFFADNSLMGIHLIDAAAREGVGRLVLLGTICAYPKLAPIPFREESLWDGFPEETNAPYGVAKRALVTYAEACQRQHGLRYVAVFPTNLYGPRDDFDPETSHVIPAMMRKCEEARSRGERTVTLWGTGEPSRDFLYVADAVTGLLKAATASGIEGDFFNLGSEQEVKIRDLARSMADVCGFRGEFRWDSSQPDGQPRRCVSAARAKAKLGFSAEWDLERGLRETLKWFRALSSKS